MITHIVFFKLKDRSPANINRTYEVLAGMEGRIPQVLSMEVGKDVLHSERSFDLALTVKLQSLQDLEAYQVHPVHKEVIDFIATVKDVTVAVDYES